MKLSSVYLCLYIYIFNWELYIYINVTDDCVYILYIQVHLNKLECREKVHFFL